MAYLFQKKYRVDGKVRKMKKWTIRFYDLEGRRQEAPGYRDRRATEALAVQLETNAERGQIGIHDPYEVHRCTPLADHVAAFRLALERKNPDKNYIDLKIKRIEALTTRCKRLIDLTEDRILDALGELVGGAQTRNHYLQAIKQFCLWAIRKKRLRDNPLVGLQAENIKLDPNLKVRRALTIEEVSSLLQATSKSRWRFKWLSGRDRYIIYLVALTTGLRVSEIASLRKCDFLLDASPAVRLKAANEKARRGVEQPVPEVIVPELMGYLRDRQADEVVWPGWWAEKAWKMIRHDLKAAGIALKNEEGMIDFHALRHTYITLLSKVLQPKLVQDLARHSDIRLTMSRYAHTQKIDRQQAVNQFPLLFPLQRGNLGKLKRATENSKVKKQAGNQVLPTGIEPVTYGLGNLVCTCGKVYKQGDLAKLKSIPPAIPPELRAVILAWPKLGAKVKKAILALAA